jgi:hypothetical protein
VAAAVPIRDLEKRIAEAASFHRLANSAHAHPESVYEYTRAARDTLARIWIDMEASGEFSPAIVDRVMEIERKLVATARSRG